MTKAFMEAPDEMYNILTQPVKKKRIKRLFFDLMDGRRTANSFMLGLPVPELGLEELLRTKSELTAHDRISDFFDLSQLKESLSKAYRTDENVGVGYYFCYSSNTAKMAFVLNVCIPLDEKIFILSNKRHKLYCARVEASPKSIKEYVEAMGGLKDKFRYVSGNEFDNCQQHAKAIVDVGYSFIAKMPKS